jgi:hypothetical protein
LAFRLYGFILILTIPYHNRIRFIIYAVVGAAAAQEARKNTNNGVFFNRLKKVT